jgi:hypothetical protein
MTKISLAVSIPHEQPFSSAHALCLRKLASSNHRAEEWVRGEAHTNNVESAWSLFNRWMVGAYYKPSTKHMDACLDEFEWKFNTRSNPYLYRETLLGLLAPPKMEYKELIKAS